MQASPIMQSLLNAISEHASDIQAVVVHLNDTYIVDERPEQKQPGFPRLIATVRMLRKHVQSQCGTDKLLVVHSGDFLGPSRLGTFDKGRTITELLNRTQVDFCVLGNHELDHGVTALQQRLSEARFRVVMNVVGTPSGIKTEPFACWPSQQNPQVAITGIVGENAQRAFKAGWSFVKCTEHIRRFMEGTHPELFRIVLTHCQRDEDRHLRNAFYDTASPVFNNSVLMLGGHDHDIDWHEYDEQPLIFKNLANLQTIRVIVLLRKAYACESERDDDVTTTVMDYSHGFVHFKLTYDDFEPAATEDTYWLDEALVPLQGKTDAIVLADFSDASAAGFDVREDTIRTRQAPFGVMACECVRRQTRADVVLLNSGMFRADAMLSPRLCRKDLLDNFLFELDVQDGKTIVTTSVCVLKNIESALVDVLLQAGCRQVGSGAYPQIVDHRSTQDGICRLAISRYALKGAGLDNVYVSAAAGYWQCSENDAEARLNDMIESGADVSVVDAMVANLAQVDVPDIALSQTPQNVIDRIIAVLQDFMMSFNAAMDAAGVSPAEYAWQLKSCLSSDVVMDNGDIAVKRDAVRSLIRMLAGEGRVSRSETFAEIYVLHRQIKAHRNTYKGAYDYAYLFTLAAHGIGGWEV